MKMILNENKKSFYTMISLIVLLITFFGLTFAFFKGQYSDDYRSRTRMQTYSDSGIFYFEIDDDISFRAGSNNMGRNDGNQAGNSHAKAILDIVERKENFGGFSRTYNIYLNIKENNFDYSCEQRDGSEYCDMNPELLLVVIPPEGVEWNGIASLSDLKTEYTYEEDGETITTVGYDITHQLGLIEITINQKISVPAEGNSTITIQDWDIRIIHVNKDINQLYTNESKEFSAKIIMNTNQPGNYSDLYYPLVEGYSHMVDDSKYGYLVRDSFQNLKTDLECRCLSDIVEETQQTYNNDIYYYYYTNNHINVNNENMIERGIYTLSNGFAIVRNSINYDINFEAVSENSAVYNIPSFYKADLYSDNCDMKCIVSSNYESVDDCSVDNSLEVDSCSLLATFIYDYSIESIVTIETDAETGDSRVVHGFARINSHDEEINTLLDNETDVNNVAFYFYSDYLNSRQGSKLSDIPSIQEFFSRLKYGWNGHDLYTEIESFVDSKLCISILNGNEHCMSNNTEVNAFLQELMDMGYLRPDGTTIADNYVMQHQNTFCDIQSYDDDFESPCDSSIVSLAESGYLFFSYESDQYGLVSPSERLQYEMIRLNREYFNRFNNYHFVLDSLFETLDTECVKKLIGEPQVTTNQEI